MEDPEAIYSLDGFLPCLAYGRSCPSSSGCIVPLLYEAFGVFVVFRIIRPSRVMSSIRPPRDRSRVLGLPLDVKRISCNTKSIMRRDSRLSLSLHTLLHLSVRTEPATSGALSACMGANPVVIRRTLAGLRRDGLVKSEKGHGGGWRIARRPESITLLDVYEALGEPVLFNNLREERPGCLVAKTVNLSLEDAYDAADVLIKKKFSEVRLSALTRELKRHAKSHQEHHK